MIRIRLKELLAEREFRERRVITLVEIADATAIHRTTLVKIANQVGYNCGLDALDRLCGYFGCRIEQLAEFIPEPTAIQGQKPTTASEERPGGETSPDGSGSGAGRGRPPSDGHRRG